MIDQRLAGWFPSVNARCASCTRRPAKLQRVREAERASVAREIHDELGQALTSINLDLLSFAHELPPHRPERDRNPSRSGVRSMWRDRLGTPVSPRNYVRRCWTILARRRLSNGAVVPRRARTLPAASAFRPKRNLTTAPHNATAVFRVFNQALTSISRVTPGLLRWMCIWRRRIRPSSSASTITAAGSQREPDCRTSVARNRRRASTRGCRGGELTVHGIPGSRDEREPAGSGMMRLLIADDHSIFRRGLQDILRRELPHVAFGEAEDAGTCTAGARPRAVGFFSFSRPPRPGERSRSAQKPHVRSIRRFWCSC